MVTVLAFLAYLPVLSQRSSLWSAELAVRACGWEWRPILQQPLLFLFQLPFHALPLTWRPVALNYANLLLAALVLGLLARAVQLWPRDRTPDVRDWQLTRLGFLPAGLVSWFPPFFAALTLGLTLNFWRQATSATGDMIDVLVLAAVICCFLEYRLDKRPKWLWRLSILYGIGMVNDWAFSGLLPCFLVAVVSMLGWRALLDQLAMTLDPIFNREKEPANMIPYDFGLLDWRPVWIVIAGLASGLTLVFLLPAIHWLTGTDHLGFWDCVIPVFYWHKMGLESMFNLISMDGLAVALALSSLLPLLLISIRWHDEETSYYTLSYWFTGKAFWVMHGLLALLSAWILLGAVIGPANMLLEQSFLPHYFICALVLGCCLNYLVRRLLGRPPGEIMTQWTPLMRRLRGALLALLVVFAAGDAALMAARNAPVIHLVNRTLPDDFFRWVLGGLPAGPKVLVADDSNILNLARLLQLGTPAGGETVYLDTAAAAQPDYHRQQLALYPPVWRTGFMNMTSNVPLRPVVLDELLKDLAATRRVFYLHPSEINPYDHFRLQDRGFEHALVWRTTNAPPAPPALTGNLAVDDPDWAEFEQAVMPQLTNAIENLGPSLKKIKADSNLMRLVQLPPPRDFTVAFFARYYSLAADARGVALQKAGRWEAAAGLFNHALDLNPYNASARANLDYNLSRRAAPADAGPVADPVAQGFGNYDSIEQAVKACGPVDDPVYRAMIADSCSQAGLDCQAAGQYERIVALEPGNWGYRFLLADLELRAGRPATTLALVSQYRRTLAAAGELPQFQQNLDMLESRANLALHNKNEALAAMDRAINAGHGDAQLMAAAVDILWRDGLKDEARDLIELLAQQHPRSEAVSVLAGYIHLALEEPAQAEQDFSRALALDPKNELARYKHGCVLIQLHRYDAARQELQTMLQYTAYAFPAHYALAQIAQAEADLPGARQELKAYLQLAATNAPDYTNALNQLRQLR